MSLRTNVMISPSWGVRHTFRSYRTPGKQHIVIVSDISRNESVGLIDGHQRHHTTPLKLSENNQRLCVIQGRAILLI